MDVDAKPSGAVADTTALRKAFGSFATGVTVVTVGGENPHGMTANSFTTVSLDPPLVLVCVGHDAIMHGRLIAAGSFAVSVLGAHQEKVARHFADRWRPLGAAQFDMVDWQPADRTGAPVIAEAAAHFECALWRVYAGGDHSIFVGQVLAMSRRLDPGALLFLNGQFGHLGPEQGGIST